MPALRGGNPGATGKHRARAALVRVFRGVRSILAGDTLMAIDPPCPLETMLSRFGAALEYASQHRQLARDGLDYINPDANCGANEPAQRMGTEAERSWTWVWRVDRLG